jgi:hypothetical protein
MSETSDGKATYFKQSELDNMWLDWLLESIQDLVYSGINEEISVCFDSINLKKNV